MKILKNIFLLTFKLQQESETCLTKFKLILEQKQQ